MLEALQVPSTPPCRCRRILLVLDEAALVRPLAAGLRRAGHHVGVRAGPSGLADEVAGERVDLVALQPELLPLDEVIAFCTSIQRRGGVWLAVISRQSDPHIAVELLHAGADCYLPLPMAPSVALAHLLAMVRRPPPALGDGLRPVTASWSLDEQARRLIGSNRMQRLSDLEYRLLLTLLDRPGAVMERPELLAAVWGPGYTNGRLVDQYVCYVRRKVEAEPSYPRAIITVGRAGYLYRPPERRPA